MLAKSHRLPASEIPRVMKYGSRVVGNGITLVYKKNLGPSTSLGMTKRFAFVISTKVDKRATVRNRMRRLLSESVRHAHDSIRPGVDGVFIGGKQLIGRTQAEVEAIIKDLLTRAKLLNP